MTKKRVSHGDSHCTTNIGLDLNALDVAPDLGEGRSPPPDGADVTARGALAPSSAHALDDVRARFARGFVADGHGEVPRRVFIGREARLGRGLRAHGCVDRGNEPTAGDMNRLRCFLGLADEMVRCRRGRNSSIGVGTRRARRDRARRDAPPWVGSEAEEAAAGVAASGVGGGRGGRGVPFKPGPKLGRAVEDELAARDEDDDADDRRSGWDEMGGAPRRKKSVLDRKTMRKRAKEDKAAQRRAWATRHQKKEPGPGDGSGGGGGGDASGGDAGKRGASKKRRGGGADEEEDDPRYVKERGGGAKRRRRDDDDDDDDDDARKGRASEKKNPNKPVTLTAEQRMGRSAYEAYKRDEAEQRRLMKKLKGRKGQEDDGMGFFFDSLPGMEILERGDEDRARKSRSPPRPRRRPHPSATSWRSFEGATPWKATTTTTTMTT